MKITRFFKELSKVDTDIAGGKGASLGEMTEAGIRVPPGFVVLTDAFERFLEVTQLNEKVQEQLDTVRQQEVESVENASKAIQSLIMDAAIPQDTANNITESFETLDADYVAVRSSATAEDGATDSWAGELDSFLNTTSDQLLNNVQRCWASLFTPRAIFYRIEKGFDKSKVSVAVVVQKMVNSEISGIAFSVHPVTEDPNQLIIEAGYGLGEAIVSGAITPDNYVVSKQSFLIVDTYLSQQERKLIKLQGGGSEWVEVPVSKQDLQKLPQDKIIELADLVVKIERHYGFPCDIEWAMENDTLYIVQSRPITTLSSTTKEKIEDGDASITLDKADWFYLGQWHQPVLSDCFWSYWHQTDFVEQFFPTQTLHGLISPDCQFWAHKTDLQFFREQTKSFSNEEASELAMKIRAKGEELKAAILNHAENPLEQYQEQLPRLFTDFREITGVWTLCWLLGDEVGKYLIDELKSYSEEDLLVIVSSHTRPTWLEEQFQGIGRLAEQIRGIIPNIPPQGITTSLLEGNPQISTLVKKFVQEFEWYGTHHWIGEPFAIKQCLSQISEYMSKEGNTQHEAGVIEGDPTGLVSLLLECAYWRTHAAEIGAKIVYLARKQLEAGAATAGLPYGDFVYLTDAEILEFITAGTLPSQMHDKLNQRKIAYGCYYDNVSLKVYTGEELQRIISQLEDHVTGDADGLIKGLVACKGGIIRGTARVVISPKDLASFNKGDILIAPETTPDFVPFMQMASAVVTDRGGVTSHAAIISRELNVPCVIGTVRATRLIKSGMTIEVNSSTGEIKIIA